MQNPTRRTFHLQKHAPSPPESKSLGAPCLAGFARRGNHETPGRVPHPCRGLCDRVGILTSYKKQGAGAGCPMSRFFARRGSANPNHLFPTLPTTNHESRATASLHFLCLTCEKTGAQRRVLADPPSTTMKLPSSKRLIDRAICANLGRGTKFVN